ncbi:DUF4326 domain-containing protein [Singulisphaera sp. PoT]|uniref:DUF4326 domain-containing protein n=1 Tax=Singulisphaera sp. PoT TaxID=3411797 RepID=UPI003BF4B7F7
MKMATVISVRGETPSQLEADPDFVYVGRSMFRQGWRDSGWGNPWRNRDFSRGIADCLLHFEQTFDAIGELVSRPKGHWWDEPVPDLIRRLDVQDRAKLTRMWVNLPLLCGKTLGCWCGRWSPGEREISCHAVILAKAANRLVEVADTFSPGPVS